MRTRRIAGVLISLAVSAGLIAGLSPAGWSLQPEGGFLTAQINYADMVPEALFGAWLRTRHIEQSTADDMTGRDENGSWVIYRQGDHIMLRNPQNNIETRLDVRSVVRDTAVFDFERQLSQGRWCHEQLSLSTTDNNHLQGYQIKECYRADGESYYSAFARVTGSRQQSLPPIR